MAEHNEIGKIGENIATKYLKTKDYKIIDRNFHVKSGEIDIIASKNGFNFHVKSGDLAFIEVKTKKLDDFSKINIEFIAENNLTYSKRQKIKKAIRHYLSFRKINENDIEIKIMAIIVLLNTEIKQAKIKVYEDFVL